MKKYVKPELFYERFELNQHIADCAWEFKNLNNNACPAYPDEKNPGSPVLFLSGNTACAFDDGGNNQVYCYQPGADGLPKVANS